MSPPILMQQIQLLSHCQLQVHLRPSLCIITRSFNIIGIFSLSIHELKFFHVLREVYIHTRICDTVACYTNGNQSILVLIKLSIVQYIMTSFHCNSKLAWLHTWLHMHIVVIGGVHHACLTSHKLMYLNKKKLKKKKGKMYAPYRSFQTNI